MRVLVCGGRDFEDYDLVRRTLDGLTVTMIIEGGQTGADRMASNWAKRSNVHSARVNALWDSRGPAAGPQRNFAMLGLNPDLVVAFPGGKGTANMCRQAEEAGIRVMRIASGDPA